MVQGSHKRGAYWYRFLQPKSRPRSRFPLSTFVAVLAINSRSYYDEFPVEGAAPDAPGLGIDMRQGLDLLQDRGHLGLWPVFRGWILDLIPWENRAGGRGARVGQLFMHYATSTPPGGRSQENY